MGSRRAETALHTYTRKGNYTSFATRPWQYNQENGSKEACTWAHATQTLLTRADSVRPPLAIRPPFSAMGSPREKGNLIDLSNPGTCSQWHLNSHLLASPSTFNVGPNRSINRPLTSP